MLAIQRPIMGSSKPPDHEMPFGYSFDATPSDFPYPTPTDPAPGPTLLDERETRFMGDFFEELGNDQFNYESFTTFADGHEFGAGWDELPPAFMGTTSSYGQQPTMGNHGIPEQNFATMNPRLNLGPSIPPSTSADVLEAATLLQNGSAGRSHSMAGAPLFGSHGLHMQQTNGNMRSQSIPQHPAARQTHGLPQRAVGESFFRHDYYRDMMFGGDPESAVRRRLSNQNMEMQWGSDVRFESPQGFHAKEQDNIAASEREHLQLISGAFNIENATADNSADNSRQASPAHEGRDSTSHDLEDDDDARPRKRRKGKYPLDEDGDSKPSNSTNSKQSTKKRRPGAKKATDEGSAPESSEQGHKRRKSGAANAAAAAKAARENLTEDQKRENHIKSEQKRRTLIREGFEDLGELVPGLKGGGFSKSAVLIMAADWLEELIQGNQELQARLDQMEGS